MIRLMLLLFLLVSTTAGARMYQWWDPDSKSVHLSGVPPSWYRSPEGGPPVRVYEGGRLVDDTSIPLSDEENTSMRDLAFRALQEERQIQAIKRLERAARREKNRRERERREASREQAESEQSDTSEAPPAVLSDSLTDEEVRRLKAIIAEYDRASGSSRADGVSPREAATQSATGASTAKAATTNY